jgi:hypothetical protein
LPLLFFIPLTGTLVPKKTLRKAGENPGKIVERENKGRCLAFASVAAFLNGSQVLGTVTDIDGNDISIKH